MDKGLLMIFLAIGGIWWFVLRDDSSTGPSFSGSGELIQIESGNFQSEVLESDVPVLANFSATWCGPCRQIAPTVEEVASELKGRARVAKIDVDKNRNIAAEYGIRGIPAFLVFKDGKAVGSVRQGTTANMVAQVEAYID